MFARPHSPDVFDSVIPQRGALEVLRAKLPDLEACKADVYLSYSGDHELRLCGFLVTDKGDIDRVIAYCPLPQVAIGADLWRKEIVRQLRIAVRLAMEPATARRAGDAVWLGYVGIEERQVPGWLYALSCIPLTYEWDGELMHPRPFCPALFERMAEQPGARRWLTRRQIPSPGASAGGGGKPPAAPIFW